MNHYYNYLPENCMLIARASIDNFLLMYSESEKDALETVKREIAHKLVGDLLDEEKVLFQQHEEEQRTVITARCFVFTQKELEDFVQKVTNIYPNPMKEVQRFDERD